MKIDFVDYESFKSKNNSFNLKRVLVTGALIAGVTLSLVGCGNEKENSQPEDLTISATELVKDPIDVSMEDINKLNVIINANGCSNEFVNDICQNLDNTGLEYQLTQNNDGLSSIVDGVVITLDQAYYSGSGIAILAPFMNGNSGDSDALALSSQAAFEANGTRAEIHCGKKQFERTEFGDVTSRVPSSTEEAVADGISFVTICIGDGDISNDTIAVSVIEALGRYSSYVQNNPYGSDLIHTGEAGDTWSDPNLANYYNPEDINNHDYYLPNDEPLFHKAVLESEQFDATTDVNVGIGIKAIY